MIKLILTGDKKIGHFPLSFIDLIIPVGGLDIEIIRNYDSRDKRLGDFGYGWTLDTTGITLAETYVGGQGWQQTVTGGFFPIYCLEETEPHIVTITDPLGNTFQYTYDAASDLISVTDRGGSNTITFTYSANHYLENINDPLGRTPMRSEYDADGRLIRHTDANGKTIEYSYDLAGHKETIIDRPGNTTTIEYDANGYITEGLENAVDVLRRRAGALDPLQ